MNRTGTNRKGITLVELLVVLLIIGILSTIAANVYIQRVAMAKVSAAKATISQLEGAIAAYQTDVGQLPPSGSGTVLSGEGTDLDNNANPSQGNGYMFLALSRSLSGNMMAPLESRWHGPYIDIPSARVGTLTGAAPQNSTALAQLQILDPWGTPFIYIRHQDYASLGGTRLPSDSVLAGSETYYNASSYQIISCGPDKVTPDSPDRGTGGDDLTNFSNIGGGS